MLSSQELQPGARCALLQQWPTPRKQRSVLQATASSGAQIPKHSFEKSDTSQGAEDAYNTACPNLKTARTVKIPDKIVQVSFRAALT